MVDLGCQDIDWVGRNDEEVLDGILLRGGLILATLGMDKGKVVMLGAFLVNFGPRGWPLGSQMVDLGCQDTDWVGRNDVEVLDGNLLRDGLILATLGVDKGK